MVKERESKRRRDRKERRKSYWIVCYKYKLESGKEGTGWSIFPLDVSYFSTNLAIPYLKKRADEHEDECVGVWPKSIEKSCEKAYEDFKEYYGK